MALEWVVLGYAAAAEAIMVILLTLPGLDRLRKGLIAVTRNLLKPFLSVVPFCLFLLMDIYWKYETRPSCEGQSCTPTEHLRHQKSIMKSQRNALLIAFALIFYWLLFSVTNLAVRLEQLNQRVDKCKANELMPIAVSLFPNGVPKWGNEISFLVPDCQYNGIGSLEFYCKCLHGRDLNSVRSHRGFRIGYPESSIVFRPVAHHRAARLAPCRSSSPANRTGTASAPQNQEIHLHSPLSIFSINLRSPPPDISSLRDHFFLLSADRVLRRALFRRVPGSIQLRKLRSSSPVKFEFRSFFSQQIRFVAIPHHGRSQIQFLW
ncbi:hypothetical protein HHK36_024480 [Tetracentron sinense]|uniref:Endoplasmic reticulum transmembrane protein n=1 Tax=Tetracentron sinense TaxID=13715 RepID=A0A834YKY9_TETSI|nr:hypothetical protein HHK36_024480 [Tetracentron sinense]